MGATIDWSGSTGDIWAKHWRETDRALAPVGETLIAAAERFLPEGPSRALDIGCGPGTTTLDLAQCRPEARIVGCDISAPLIDVARSRAVDFDNVEFVSEDAESAALRLAPVELFLSRHGVMFFVDPVRAFRTMRRSASVGGSLVFSCFQAWERNPWASELASAAAGRVLAPPGREAGGFAFADPDYARDLLQSSGWADEDVTSLPFSYVVDGDTDVVQDSLAFFATLGPASRELDNLPAAERESGLERMRAVIADHVQGSRVEFPAAAWIWTARAL